MSQISFPQTHRLELVPEVESQIEAADAAIACFSADYLNWVRDDITVMRDSAVALERALSWDDVAAAECFLQTIRMTAETVRDQAGSFGFALVSDIAGSLCHALAGAEPQSVHIAVLNLHFAAIEKAVALGLKGDGGAIGAELITSLH